MCIFLPQLSRGQNSIADDPLSEIIPSKNILDWEELDCSPEFSLDIRSVE